MADTVNIYKADNSRYEKMTYNPVGKSGLKFPAISLGLWHNFGSKDNYDNMKQMLRTAFDSGITQFDLANNYGPVYGSAENNFGKILRRISALTVMNWLLLQKLVLICGMVHMVMEEAEST